MKTIAVLAALMLGAGAANAFPYPGSAQFTDAKTGYVVTVSDKGGEMILDGRHPVTRQTFHITVSQAGQVRGTWGERPCGGQPGLHGGSTSGRGDGHPDRDVRASRRVSLHC